MARDNPQETGVAIKLVSSVSSPSRAKPTSQPLHGGRRHRAQGAHALHHDDSESEDEDYQPQGQLVSISEYGIGGASNKSKSSRKRVEDSSTSRDEEIFQGTESETRNRQYGAQNEDQRGDEREDRKPIKYGLTINKKPVDGDAAATSQEDAEGKGGIRFKTENIKRESKPRTADEEALESLISESSGIKKRKRDSLDQPDREPEEDDYKSIPVDDFGANLLKKFGWDGKMRGKVKEVPQRHADFTGLGAKKVKGAEEFGAWDQKGQKDERRPRINDHRKEEERKRRRQEERHGDSYKRERDRERERDRDRDRDRR